MVFGFAMLFVGSHRSTWGDVFWVFTEKSVTDNSVAEKPGTEKPATEKTGTEKRGTESPVLCWFSPLALPRQLKILSLKNL